MMDVSLIGGPADGDLIDLPTGSSWCEVSRSRYVIRDVFAASGEKADGRVGIHLPLYATLLRAHLERSSYARSSTRSSGGLRGFG